MSRPIAAPISAAVKTDTTGRPRARPASARLPFSAPSSASTRSPPRPSRSHSLAPSKPAASNPERRASPQEAAATLHEACLHARFQISGQRELPLRSALECPPAPGGVQALRIGADPIAPSGQLFFQIERESAIRSDDEPNQLPSRPTLPRRDASAHPAIVLCCRAGHVLVRLLTTGRRPVLLRRARLLLRRARRRTSGRGPP